MNIIFKDFHEAFWFLKNHNLVRFNNKNYFHVCLNIDVVKVNPLINSIDDNDANNTKTEVWLEFGKYDSFEMREGYFIETAQHDVDLDCGHDTFEKAIIELANLVFDKYGNEKFPLREGVV